MGKRRHDKKGGGSSGRDVKKQGSGQALRVVYNAEGDKGSLEGF